MLALGLTACGAGAAIHPPTEVAAVTPGSAPIPLVDVPAAQRATSVQEVEAGAIGTPHPVLLRAAAADGGWAVLCQARTDTDGDGRVSVEVAARGTLSRDRLDTYLVEGSGAGEPIDTFVGADPRGRYLVFERAGRLILRDSWERLETDLSESGALVGTDKASFLPHRAAAFSSDGRRLLYLRRRGQRDWVVVRELDGGLESVIDPGDGLLVRAEFDATGEWLLLRVVDADTNADGRWEWPHGKPGPSEPGCVSPIPHFRVPPAPPDKPGVRVTRVSGGPVRAVRGFVTSFGAGGVLRRSEDRALFFDPVGAESELWSPSMCDGRLLHADPVRGLLVVACATEEGPREVELVARRSRQKLNLLVGAFEIDNVFGGSPRLLPLYVYPGPDTRLLDLESGQLIALERRDRVIASHGSNVLIRRSERLYWGDAHAPLELLGAFEPLAPLVHQAPLVFAAPWVVDLAERRLLGRVNGEGLALSSRGAVLVASQPGESNSLPMGPLRWALPSPTAQ